MPRLKLHFDGWLSLPAHFREQLGLHAGAEIEAELVEGPIALRPSRGSAKPVTQGVAREAAETVPAPPAMAAAVHGAGQLASTPEAPPMPKRRGRPPKARPAAKLK